MILEQWDRRLRALNQFRVADVVAPVLEKADEHHLRKVLRAREGEEIVVTDGGGQWAIACVRQFGLDRVSEVAKDPAPVATTIYMAPLKSDRSEWAVAKLTELGVTRVVPLLCERLAVKFKGEAKEKIILRWRRIAQEAAGQCRRTYDVEIGVPVTVSELPSDVAIATFGGSGDWSGVQAVAIGPEGGFTDDEVAGRRLVSLGSTVLRAETAALAAGSFLTAGWGSWGFTPPGPVVG